MSIDVEDWFQVENLRGTIAREAWPAQELRVERNVDRMLELMAAADVRATCFVLGWIAERCPRLVERIAAAGHEIASHGYGHELLSQLTPDTFREDVVRSKTLLEQMVATEVVGYRAPSFSITDWAIPVLAELGFTYDSSFFPTFAHDRYGRLSGIDGRAAVSEPLPGFHEVSISCLRVGSRALPWGGGGYFRLLPYPLFRLGARRILETAEPYVFYIHPWEIDPRQPRIKGLPRASAFRHYVGLDRCETRFERLLRDFSWSSIRDLLRENSPQTDERVATGYEPVATASRSR